MWKGGCYTSVTWRGDHQHGSCKKVEGELTLLMQQHRDGTCSPWLKPWQSPALFCTTIHFSYAQTFSSKLFLGKYVTKGIMSGVAKKQLMLRNGSDTSSLWPHSWHLTFLSPFSPLRMGTLRPSYTSVPRMKHHYHSENFIFKPINITGSYSADQKPNFQSESKHTTCASWQVCIFVRE